jgi:hypothetical protein
MSLLDWTVLVVTLGGVVSYGLWRSRGCRDLDHCVLAERPTSTMALSIMATQASAARSSPLRSGLRRRHAVRAPTLACRWPGHPGSTAVRSSTGAGSATYQYLEQRFDVRTDARQHYLHPRLALGIRSRVSGRAERIFGGETGDHVDCRQRRSGHRSGRAATAWSACCRWA